LDFDVLEDKTILLTGGTGSFGKVFTRLALEKSGLRKLIIFSRDEMKQWDMQNEFSDSRLRFFLGDVRDKDRLLMALRGVDFVIHGAATKIVPTAEYNPFECIKTNVLGAMNIIDASILSSVQSVVALSTDKASSPINLYGATKLCSDKLFCAAGNYVGGKETKFAVVRYGNVMGSRGSVIPFFLRQKKEGKKLTITDSRMTRFMITLEEGISLVLTALRDSEGGEIFVKKIPSISILDVAEAVDPGGHHEFIGIREGEKLHEQMISVEDSMTTYAFEDYFKILPNINGWASDPKRIGSGEKVGVGFVYESSSNVDWMSVEELRRWISDNKQKIGQI
jgi:UDP-N-acetylglucosamine 4,6-dehydratase